MRFAGRWLLLLVLPLLVACNAILSNDFASAGGENSTFDATTDAKSSPDGTAGGGDAARDATASKDEAGVGAVGPSADAGCDPTDVHSCGSCTNDCTKLPYVSASGLACRSGACVYGCAPGFADCADAGVGCTTPVNTATSCGGCGVTCPTVSPLCAQADAGAYHCVSGCPGSQTDCSGTCADLQSDPTQCGACGVACAPSQTCAAGTCVCPAASAPDFCGSACTSVKTDSANCGTCGHACSGGETCQAGVCACPAGQTLCGSTCVDATTDSLHCGSSCTACAGGTTCQGGTCQCPLGTTLCAGQCVDVQGTDVNNCGACGQSCPALPHVSSAGVACKAGKCSYQCTGGFADCADAGTGCTTNATTASNCGACGASCPAATPVCSASDAGTTSCATGCAAGQVVCGSSCTVLATDPSNCGMCNMACAATELCSAGACGCASGKTSCPGDGCVDLKTSNTDCGTCGHACPAASSCVNGTCTCPATTPPSILCGASCVNVQTDPNNCGGCGKTCAAPLSCIGGSCTCPASSTGQTLVECGTSPAICTSTQTDNANCGTCGNTCPTLASCASGNCQCPNGTLSCGGVCATCNTPVGGLASCSGKTCSFVCDASSGFGACGSGCANLQTDAANCGSCGHSCQGGTCAKGACQPLVLGTGIPSSLAVDGSGVYWTDSVAGTVSRCAVGGCNQQPTIVSTAGPDGPIATDTSNVYFTRSNSPGIVVQCPKTGCGANPTVLTPDTGTIITWLAPVQSNTLFWAGGGNILSCPTAGCASVTTLAINQGVAPLVVTDGNNTFWAAEFGFTQNEILSCPVAGCGQMPTVLTTDTQDIFEGITFFSGQLYATAAVNSTGKLVKISEFGAGQTESALPTTLSNPSAIAVDSSGIYVIDSGSVVRANLDGTNKTTIAPAGQATVSSGSTIATDSTSIYWVGPSAVMKLAK